MRPLNFYAECAVYIIVGGGVGALVGQGLHTPPAVQVAGSEAVVITVVPTPTLLIIPASIAEPPAPLALVLDTPQPTATPQPSALPQAVELPTAPPAPGPFPIPTLTPTAVPRRIPIPNPAPARQPAVSPFVPNSRPASGS
jgi:hypothetical protein